MPEHRSSPGVAAPPRTVGFLGVALLPVNTKVATPEIEGANEPDHDNRQIVVAESDHDENEAAVAQPEPDSRQVVLARHIMALDRLGERMVELEGKVALLPALPRSVLVCSAPQCGNVRCWAGRRRDEKARNC